jgi:uncharacterized protein
MERPSDRFVQFVVKTSKLCNLRCRYCYEMKELGNKEAMRLEQLRQMYRHIRDYYVEADRRDGQRTEVRFIWHGGEPLLLEPAFYWSTFSDQEAIFGDALGRINVVQTNLTVLDDARLRLLRDGFDSVGISVDLFGGLRVNVIGRDQQDRVLRNMALLRREGVAFSCITVLSARNVEHIEAICRFYEQAGIPFRLLPLFDGATAEQNESFDLGTSDILRALCAVVDHWLQGDGRLEVEPVDEAIRVVVDHLAGAPSRYFDKRAWTPTILVNTSGDCYSYGDPYGDPAFSLGNLFTTPLAEIMAGERMERSCRAAEERMAFNCTRCKYFGSCSGYPIAEDRSNCREVLQDGIRVCVVERALYAHIERRLREVGMVDADGRLHLPVQAAAQNPLPAPGSPAPV